MILGLGLILLLVLGAVAIAPKKLAPAPNGTPQPMLMQASGPVPAPMYAPQVSYREQILSEEAGEVSAAFRDAANKQWRAEVIAKASTLLASP